MDPCTSQLMFCSGLDVLVAARVLEQHDPPAQQSRRQPATGPRNHPGLRAEMVGRTKTPSWSFL